MEKTTDIYATKKKSLSEFLSLIRPKDFIATGIATGQPLSLLNSLSDLPNLERLDLFTGLLAFPYPILSHPKAFTTSGYYGPIERMLNENNFNMAYLPLPFQGFETYVDRVKPRVILAALSSMDENGFLSFGTNAEAVYRPFMQAARDPERLAIAEVNPKMPRVLGIEELGNHRVHISELDAIVENEHSLLELPLPAKHAVETKIAEQVISLIRSRDTLQFGIGGIPNQVAEGLAASSLDEFGIHSELISDGFLTLMESGKISNRHQGQNAGISLFSFALGSQRLYDFLDERNGHNQGRVRAAPASYVNDPHQIAKHPNFASINSGFMIDFAGQVCSEAIAEKQYSGVGGQLSFMEGAFFSPGGRSILCIKSTAEFQGQLYSNIAATLPPGSLVSTPRHYVQYVVTEYGIANLFGLTDEERPWALIPLAHPQFRENLEKQAYERDQKFYHSRSSKA